MQVIVENAQGLLSNRCFLRVLLTSRIYDLQDFLSSQEGMETHPVSAIEPILLTSIGDEKILKKLSKLILWDKEQNSIK